MEFLDRPIVQNADWVVLFLRKAMHFVLYFMIAVFAGIAIVARCLVHAELAEIVKTVKERNLRHRVNIPVHPKNDTGERLLFLINFEARPIHVCRILQAAVIVVAVKGRVIAVENAEHPRASSFSKFSSL